MIYKLYKTNVIIPDSIELIPYNINILFNKISFLCCLALGFSCFSFCSL